MNDAPSEPGAGSPEQQALLQAVQAVLAPLARLAVARGLHFGTVEEQLKVAFVAAAREAALRAHPQALPHRLVSRLATATGISRREVTRLVQADLQAAEPRRSPPVQVFARWTTDPVYLDGQGQPRPLQRQGPAPSFESLAASITRDVHPRSLLDGLVGLRLAELDEGRDEVRLLRTAFVPREDQVRMLGFLGSNVGAHLAAAVENVEGRQPPHLEQAIKADGLSAASVADMHALIQAQWRLLARALVPELQRRIDQDDPGADTLHRLRVGLYMYADQAPALAAPQPPAPSLGAGSDDDEELVD
ncbi:DUF6502 family protein [Ideonella livida]|uniref:Uncharacterized protein n=1 Tax=Ideonella livida TaxID=2707176 RepID=A0A7C9TJ69_9BURK|nr:DUF6502 family protein [Ideonella livida]NDY91558.1 hypothetical protein [Ideonella livida]